MSISAYVGLPGSGKSYGVIENVIIPACKNNREVWTNIPCNQEKFINDFGFSPTQFTTQEILNDKNWFQDVLPKGALVVIDECWRLWPAGLKTNNMEENHKSFLAEHRHMVGDNGNSTEIILLTQDLAQIASYPRNLVETTYRTTQLNAVGAKSKYRIDIYGGCITGPNPPDKTKLDSQYGSYKKRNISILYISHYE